MKRILCVSVLLLAVALSASAQESTSKAKLGIGIGLEPFRLFSGGGMILSTAMAPVTFSVPIEFGSGMRFEPEIGLFHFSEETGTTTKTTNTASFYRLGAGFYFPVSSGENTKAYFGPKVGLFLMSEKTVATSTSEQSETDFFVALVLGGEYAVSNAFRVYGEAQVYYLSFGKPDVTPPPPSSSDRSQSVIFSNAVIGIRFYF